MAHTMHEIGRCLLKMNKLTEAQEYLEKALQIEKQISLDVDKDESVTHTMHAIGRCLLKMNKLFEAIGLVVGLVKFSEGVNFDEK